MNFPHPLVPSPTAALRYAGRGGTGVGDEAHQFLFYTPSPPLERSGSVWERGPGGEGNPR